MTQPVTAATTTFFNPYGEMILSDLLRSDVQDRIKVLGLIEDFRVMYSEVCSCSAGHNGVSIEPIESEREAVITLIEALHRLLRDYWLSPYEYRLFARQYEQCTCEHRNVSVWERISDVGVD